MLLRRVTLLLSAVVLFTACAAASSSAPDTLPTVPVGELPAPIPPPESTTKGPESTPLRSTTTLAPEQQVGSKTKGNRVILIGDSVMASTSRRYSNDMCQALVPQGWQAEVDAETSRFIPFGNKVLDKRLSAGWDASVILLGNNYAGDQEGYRKELEKMVTRLSPNPVVLLTVTQFRPDRAEVNTVIMEMADKYPNVMIIDWAGVTGADSSLTGGDGLHLTTRGREVLAEVVAMALGTAPAQPGKCLDSNFKDDSGGPVTGTTVKGGAVTQTTKKPSTGATTTTVKGSTGSSTTTGSDAPVTTVAKPSTTAAAPSTVDTVVSKPPVPSNSAAPTTVVQATATTTPTTPPVVP